MLKKSDVIEVAQIVFLSLAFAGMVSYAWTAPAENPPGSNSLPAVNISADSQTKTGPIWASSFLTDSGGYFGGNVGLGVANPQAKLHIGGTAGVDGIMFPDGTVQTTAAN